MLRCEVSNLLQLSSKCLKLRFHLVWAGVVDLLVCSLLNPVECIRKQIVFLIRRINKGESKFGNWLFHLLKDHRKVADEHPEHCQEFYGLLQELCKGFEKCTRLTEVGWAFTSHVRVGS